MASYNNDSDTRMDMGAAVEKNVDVTKDGQLKVFNWTFDIGDPQLAAFMRSGVTWATNEISRRGATTAKQLGETIGKEIGKLSRSGDTRTKTATIAGKIAYNTWLFGWSAADFALGLKKTVQNGFKSMHSLREDAQPLLAANNQSDSNISSVLTHKQFGVLAHARAKIYHDVKSDIVGGFVDGIRLLPNIVMGIQKKQMDILEGKNSTGGRVDMAQTHVTGETPDIQALKQTYDDVFNPDVWRKMRHPQSIEDYKHNLNKLSAATPVVDFIAGIFGRKFSHQQMPDDAWDYILTLQHYVKQNTPEVYEVKTKVKKIFDQRARDLGKPYKLEGSAYDAVIKVVSEAIVEDGLHPQALVEILDNPKIVNFDKHDADFGDPETIKHEVDKLVTKYNLPQVEKEIYRSAPFTKKTLVETYKNIPEEEKPFFTLLFPPGVLEAAGISHDEAKKYREAGKQEFEGQLTDRLRLIIGQGHDALVQAGVKESYVEALEGMESAFRRADNRGVAADYVIDNIKSVKSVVRNIEASAKKPGEMWKSFVERNESMREEPKAKTPFDHAQRDPEDQEILSPR